jgi:hypothetical protein
MTITQNVDPNIYELLSESDLQKINSYITDTATATWFNDRKPEGAAPVRQNKQIITSELIYYWMVSYRIPFECQKWHLNRLIMLIKILEQQNKKPTKKTQSEMIRKYADINERNKAKYKTKG